MRKEIVFVLFLFFISNCFAQEINFQKEIYSPSETIIGSINNVVGELRVDNLQVYEGRREVFFEKGLIRVNQTYYFYVIPTKEGEFSLKVDNLLYNNSGTVSSINLEKKFNISQTNESIGLGVRPGVYEGQKPEVIVTNLKANRTNITINKEIIEFNALESKKLILNVTEGFSLYPIGDYSIPTMKFSFLNNASSINTSIENGFIQNNSYSGCIGLRTPPFFSIAKNEVFNYSIDIQNNCSENLTEFLLKSTDTGITFVDNNFTIERDKTVTINFSLIEKIAGDYSVNISLIQQNKEMNNIQLKVYCFENKTTLENFTQTYDNPTQENCGVLKGNFCADNEQCSTDNRVWDTAAGKMCCLSECINLNAKETNWINIIIAILGLGVIGAVAYLLLKRSHGLKAPKAEDKFKEAEKRYEKNISGTKK